MTYNLNQTLQRLEKLQYESSVGKKFRVPSDDPIGASKSLKFNTDISKVEQYLRNAKDAKAWLLETESVLNEISTVLHRANVLTVQAANGPNEQDLSKIRDEIEELRDHLILIANSTYAGRTLFTGFKTDKELLDEDGNYKIDINNEEVFIYNVGVAEKVPVNTLGNKVFGSGAGNYTDEVGEGDKAYLIQVFDDLALALDPNNPDSHNVIQESLTKIKDSMNQILSVTSELGARTNRLELTESKLEDQLLTLQELLSFNEDVSLPDALMRLAIEENVYRASLGVSASIIQPSLMDFLR